MCVRSTVGFYATLLNSIPLWFLCRQSYWFHIRTAVFLLNSCTFQFFFFSSSHVLPRAEQWCNRTGNSGHSRFVDFKGMISVLHHEVWCLLVSFYSVFPWSRTCILLWKFLWDQGMVKCGELRRPRAAEFRCILLAVCNTLQLRFHTKFLPYYLLIVEVWELLTYSDTSPFTEICFANIFFQLLVSHSLKSIFSGAPSF